MKTSRFLLPAFLALSPAFSFGAAAQNVPGNFGGDFNAPADNGINDNGVNDNGINPNAVDAGSRVLQVGAANLANLPGLLSRPGLGAVSLGASEAEFAANAGAQAALFDWVRGGGTVFLHTGAARAFGFQTVEARLGTNVLAGQIYGRARAALPFGAHPLLWDDGRSVLQRRAPGADPTRFPGVDTVFYQLREGDHLVVGHPAGTPLLTVSDLAGGVETGTLFAAAIAPVGRGFAVFTPDAIDQNRGDGALFARNLLNLVVPAPGARPSASAVNARLVGVAASVIEKGAANPDALGRALAAAGAAPRGSAALPAFGTAPQRTPLGTTNEAANNGALDTVGMNNGAFNGGAGVAPQFPGVPNGGAPDALADAPIFPAGPNAQNENNGIPAAPPTAAVVLLSRAEANSYGRLIAAGGDRAGAAINLLRARLFLGRGDTLNAGRALDASEEFAPNSAEVSLWRGILRVGGAQNVGQPSPVRAELVTGAARDFAQAARGASILSANFNGAANGIDQNGDGAVVAPVGATLAGIPLAALRSWSTKLGQIGEVFALEPPLVQSFGVGPGAITVRAIANDDSLLYLLPSVQILANARNFGWHGDNEEVLLFPNAQTYLTYRRALGLVGPTVPLSPGAVGDVVGQRLSLIGVPTFPLAGPNPTTGQGVSLANNSGPAGTLARLHSYVLLGAYDEGARSPAWLQRGLENLINAAVTSDNRATFSPETLEANAQTGGLLTPQQFTNLANAAPAQIFLAQSQSSALMGFFYRAYGAGAVTETVQRLGAGQNIDQALLATTQGDETAFFRDWRLAQFGPRIFPNRG